jgi:hypothetical protein
VSDPGKGDLQMVRKLSVQHRGGKMGNGGWKMEDGEWKMEDGEWRMENCEASIEA